MNFKRKMMHILLLVIMIFSISACGAEQVAKESPQEAVTIAIEKLKAAKSLSSNMTFDVKLLTGEQASEEKMEIQADFIYEPLSLKIIGTKKTDAQTLMEIKTYVQEENGKLVTYEAYGNQWNKQTVDKASLMSSVHMYDSKENAIAFLERALDIQEISRENKEVVLEITIPEKDLQEVAESTQIFRMPGLSGLPPEYYKGIGDLKILFVMDELTGLPKSYKLDLSAAAQTLINNLNHYLLGAAEEGSAALVPTSTVERFVIDVQIQSVDKTEKIVLPKEALEGAVDVAEQIKMNDQSAAKTSGNSISLQEGRPLEQSTEEIISE